MNILDMKHDISGLEALADKMGYKEERLHIHMSRGDKVIDLRSVLNFLEDNPGAVEAIFEWAEDSFHTEDLQDDEDDWCADCDHENDDCMCPNEEA